MLLDQLWHNVRFFYVFFPGISPPSRFPGQDVGPRPCPARHGGRAAAPPLPPAERPPGPARPAHEAVQELAHMIYRHAG